MKLTLKVILFVTRWAVNVALVAEWLVWIIAHVTELSWLFHGVTFLLSDAATIEKLVGIGWATTDASSFVDHHITANLTVPFGWSVTTTQT